MKLFNFSFIILFALSACGQNIKTKNEVSPKIASPNLSREILNQITSEICNCTSSNMKGNKPSTSLDSCFKYTIAKYSDSLKAINFDLESQSGKKNLEQKVIGNLYFVCKDIQNLLEKEFSEERTKKLLFTGTIVSQTKLQTGKYQIIMQESKTKSKKVFISATTLSNPRNGNKNVREYELTIEYEIINNPKTNKEEYYIKANASSTGISVEKVETSQ